MRDRLLALAESARREIGVASEVSAVEALRVRYLGKKGELSGVLGGMGKLPPEERKALGEVANQVKAEIEKLLISTQHREGAESLIPDDLWEHVVEPILPKDLYVERKLR